MLDEIRQGVCDTQSSAAESTVPIGRRDTSIAAPAETSKAEYRPGDRVGRYRIRSVIASGGMGTVFLAEQVEPVRRDVALKIVRADIATPAMVQQFLDERQVLAKLDHPDIARIYDADATPSGQPFFVMEFADGRPIDKYCDERQLSIRERVTLMIRVCRAVESAHRRGVVHCDLKPSNILISDADGRPQVKIIDFGIARTQRDSAEAPQSAAFGTPNYMSPEQAAHTEIDARTDEYSLGAVMFRLLAGSVPIEPLKRTVNNWPELRAALIAFTPELMSERILATDAVKRESLAAERSLSISQLKRVFRGDLDWVARRALANPKSDRYATVGDFADDLQRYLDDRPLMTAAPSRGYRVQKFCRRHRGAVFGAAIAIGILLFSAIILTAGWIDERNREQAELAVARSEAESLLDDAESAWRRARQGGPHAEAELSRAEASTSGVKTILKDHKSLADIVQRLQKLQRKLAIDRNAFDLVRELDRARELASGTDLQGKRDGVTVHDGMQAIEAAFRKFGITPGKTPPEKVAEMLSLISDETLRKIVETLDFVINESPTGAGFYLHDVAGRFSIVQFLAGGAAAKHESLSRGDRLVAIEGREITGFPLSQVYRLLAGPAGSLLRIRIADYRGRETDIELRRQGQDAYWARDVLKQIDADAWRTKLRTALLQADADVFQELAGSPETKSQWPFNLIQLANGLKQVGDSKAALRILQIARQQSPENFWANHYLGIASITVARPVRLQDGVRFLTAAVSLRPKSGVAHRNLAMALYRVQAVDEAVCECRIAMEAEPGRLKTLEMAAAILEHSQRHEEALREFDAIRKRYPKQADWSERAAWLAFRVRDYRKAIERADAALQADRLRWSSLEAKAGALVQIGRSKEAVSFVRQHLAVHPHHPLLQRALGNVLIGSRQYKEAIVPCTQALNGDPFDAASRFYYGISLQYSGDTKAALREFRLALALRPDYADVQRHLDATMQTPIDADLRSFAR